MDQKKLGFGFMRLPTKGQGDNAEIDMAEVNKMVDAFLDQGFTYFDTAYMYHAFKSEIALRESLVKRHDRSAFTVATKLPTMFLKEASDQERIFAEQLEKCGVDYFDYYLLHNLNVFNYEIAQKFDSFAFIGQKKSEGKIRNIGFSFHDRADLLDEILIAHPEIDFVQLQINYADWDNESIQSRKCYEIARKHAKPIVVMEPVKGGTLAQLPERAKSEFRKLEAGMSDASWAIRFAASLDGVLTVLSGMTSMEQLMDNTRYMRDFRPLSEVERLAVERVSGIIRESVAVPCTACRYCVAGCPKNVAIPEYFALYNAEKLAKPKGFSIQAVYYGNVAKTHGKASDCIDCKKCEKSCPQHLEIARYLKDVVQTFEKDSA